MTTTKERTDLLADAISEACGSRIMILKRDLGSQTWTANIDGLVADGPTILLALEGLKDQVKNRLDEKWARCVAGEAEARQTLEVLNNL